MIFDMHSHIMPYVDDGAKDIYESVEMAYMAVEHGTTVMALTPHANHKGLYENYSNREMQEIYLQLQEALRKENLPLQLVPGMEIFVTPDMMEYIAEGKLCPYAGTNLFLVEFPFSCPPADMEFVLRKMLKFGMRPMLAHPERYYCVQDDVSFLQRMVELGCYVQMNKGSVFDRFGTRSGQTARSMLESGLVHVCGSDAHGSKIRTPEMRSMKDYIVRHFGQKRAEQLLVVNPRNLLGGIGINEMDS